jgi:hypothetical protein
MMDGYWSELAEPFQKLTFAGIDLQNSERILADWLDLVIRTAQSALTEALQSIGTDAVTLRYRVKALALYDYQMKSLRQKHISGNHS